MCISNAYSRRLISALHYSVSSIIAFHHKLFQYCINDHADGQSDVFLVHVRSKR